MTTATLTKLTKIVVDRPAPKPDGMNLWIDLDINLSKSTALIHSRAEEFVGTHKDRKVTFRADHDCWLSFTNPDVFDLKSVNLTSPVQLTEFVQVVLPIKDTTTNATTYYEIYIGAPPLEAVEPMQETVVPRGGPHIVVP